jgi:serine/threonine protein kinase
MIIFNSKGLEVDEVDIQYLKDGQVLFVSLDGQPFNPVNYLNQYEFVKYVKSGGYGKIYIAKDLITEQLVAIKKIETNVLSKK